MAATMIGRQVHPSIHRSRAAVPQDRHLTIAGHPCFHTVLRKILIKMRKTTNRDLEMLTWNYLLLVK